MHQPRPLFARDRVSTALQFARASLLTGVILATVGCQSMGFKGWKVPKLENPVGTTNEDPWTTQAGSEGRAGRAIEKEWDPLHLKRFLLSDKAAEIERNCGYE